MSIFVRAVADKEMLLLKDKVIGCAKGAALATGRVYITFKDPYFCLMTSVHFFISYLTLLSNIICE